MTNFLTGDFCILTARLVPAYTVSQKCLMLYKMMLLDITASLEGQFSHPEGGNERNFYFALSPTTGNECQVETQEEPFRDANYQSINLSSVN